MPKSSDQPRDDAPKAAKPKPKLKPRSGPPATKAERAAQMRADKMVIKRMRKR